MDGLQETVAGHDNRLASLEEHAETIHQRLVKVEASCGALQAANWRLQAKLTDLEGRSRRSNVRLTHSWGLTERHADVPGSHIQDYSPEVVNQRREYGIVMSSLYKMGLKPSLLYPARLHIAQPDGSHTWLGSVAEAEKFIRHSVTLHKQWCMSYWCSAFTIN